MLIYADDSRPKENDLNEFVKRWSNKHFCKRCHG